MISKNLKAIRKSKNIKVNDLLSELKKNGVSISSSTYYKWEEGERDIPHEYIPKLCLSLGITIDFLYMADAGSEMFKQKLNLIESVKDFLCVLDDDIIKMLIHINRNWDGDFIASLNMIGAYAAQPVEMRRDVASLCFHNFVNAVKDGEADKDIAKMVNLSAYTEAIGKLYGGKK